MWVMVEVVRQSLNVDPSSEAEPEESDRARELRLAYEAKRVAASDASIAAGRLIPMAAVRAWINSIVTQDELPLPRHEVCVSH